MKLGEVLRKERERRGIAPARMAAMIGLSEEDYRALEAGARNFAQPTSPIRSRLSSVLGISEDELAKLME